ncbi:dUTPase [Staphylococcus felis]|uniref:dUTPase n=1 Tax=Staphylococcus felis TaxID=46127 RepID=A0ABS0QLH7_9STAP|nr:dUTPase [Staphylococcus felis]MBH9580072.1 dUTPase [Staphylococcus felis]REI05458.1 dUTPase [Staphylococcus felis]
MTNQLTVYQLQELLTIQKEFDDRIPTLNIEDTKTAYIVEFFEWFNTLETFKNWKKKPGKPIETQLDELADMLAFGLSIFNQSDMDVGYLEEYLPDAASEYDYKKSQLIYHFMEDVTNFGVELDEAVLIPLNIAYNLYTIDQLIVAYKRKMKRNHARQNGTADTDKGYV